MDLFLSSDGLISRIYASASAEQSEINRLFNYWLIMSAIILLIVGFMVIYGVYHYHEKRRPAEPKQIAGNRTLEILWTLIPLVTLAIFFVITLRIMKNIDRPFDKTDKPDIKVVAHQFWWEIHYTGEKFATANELHIPVKKTLLMQLTSSDVIHDWWVTELGRKMDAIPGRYNYNWIEADRTGSFKGTCGEYCGAEHAWMRILVIAENEDDFNRWKAHQSTDFQPGSDSLTISAVKLFQQKTCSNCHAIRGTTAHSFAGPDLTHLMTRQTLISGVFKNTPGNLKRWIRDPQRIKPGARMPNLMLNEHELQLITNLMEELK